MTGQEAFKCDISFSILLTPFGLEKSVPNPTDPATEVTRDQRCVNQILPGVTKSLIVPSDRIVTCFFMLNCMY